MRSVSGVRNRVVLVLAGALVVVAGAWVLASALGAAAAWPQAGGLFAAADATPATLFEAHRGWMLPVAAAVSVLAVVLGIVLLVWQVPSRAPVVTLRFADQDGLELAAMEPGVLETALTQRVEAVPGVLGCAVWMSGSARACEIQARVTVSDDAEIVWVIREARHRLFDDVGTALGRRPGRVDLLAELRSPARSTRDSSTTASPA